MGIFRTPILVILAVDTPLSLNHAISENNSSSGSRNPFATDS
jgi:hypothetical protein